MIPSLVEVERAFSEYLIITDWEAVRILLATAACHCIKGEPTWLRFIGPSRSGKTEILRAIGEHSDSETMEAMTPASIRGGFKGGHKVLERINGKLVITKDIAALITTRPDVKKQILGLLRSVKDGGLDSDFGTPSEGHVYQKSRFDWIIGATSAVDTERSLDALLGQRFIDLRWKPKRSEEAGFRASIANPKLTQHRKHAAKVVCELIDDVKKQGSGVASITEEDLRWIAKLVNKVALFRTTVPYDNNGNLVTFPVPEFPTELAQSFSRIALSILSLEIPDWRKSMIRLGWDCIHPIRAKILQTLMLVELTAEDISEISEIPISTTYFNIKSLLQLKIIEKKNDYYYIKVRLE